MAKALPIGSIVQLQVVQSTSHVQLDETASVVDPGVEFTPFNQWTLLVRALAQPTLELPKSLLAVRPFAARPSFDAFQVYRLERRDT